MIQSSRQHNLFLQFFLSVKVFAVLTFPAICSADQLILNTGAIIDGTLIQKTDDFVEFENTVGVVTTYYWDEIKAIEGNSVSFPQVADQQQKNTPKTISTSTIVEDGSPQDEPLPTLNPDLEMLDNFENKFKESAVNMKTAVNDVLTFKGTDNNYIEHQLTKQVSEFKDSQNQFQYWIVSNVKNAYQYAKDHQLYKDQKFLTASAFAYALFCFPLMIIAMKHQVSGAWLAWIPVLNLLLMLRITERSYLWILALFIPVINIIVLGYLAISFANMLYQPKLYGILLLIPVVNILVLWYWAFAPSANPIFTKTLIQEKPAPAKNIKPRIYMPKPKNSRY